MVPRDREPFYPVVRGRIMAINTESLLKTDDTTVDRRQRESNLTWSDTLPPDNELLAGQWWPARSDDAVVSVEQSFAQRLDIEVGDTLAFLVGSQPLEVRVTSTRELEWQSLRPKFFLVFPPRLLEAYPATFMTAFDLESTDKVFEGLAL